MFTGIIETTGAVLSINPTSDSSRITFSAPVVLSDAAIGASIAVNGVCLTVTEFDSDNFSADLMHETLKRSSLGNLTPGDRVNIERAMPLSGRLGGHIVQGHVDAIATVRSIEPSEDWTLITCDLPTSIARYVVEKGSITVSGVSLTVVQVSEPTETAPWFSVSLIPTTLRDTTLGTISVGDHVNLEVDALAKYVERILAFTPVKEN
ncbi:MAG: riboflavin synthase [Candidatus Nanopelagicales bacterium]|jgi:riboflavin synthase|nr:riboflavin synthase [Actinomycetes bacterium]